jgi:outer membrane protein
MQMLPWRRRAHLALLLPLIAGCAAAPPHTRGVAGVAPAADRFWTPPAVKSAPVDALPGSPTIPPEAIADRLANLTLAEVVDVALANSPVTRAAWADAKAAAAGYGSAKGDRLPTLDGTAGATRSYTGGPAAAAEEWTTTYGPGATLSWKVLDFGGRGGRVEAARQAMLAADWTHNAVLQDAIFTVEAAFYRYAGAKAILAANQLSYAEAESSVTAAETRHDVGLATIADVLQARTARAQAKLELQATEGQVRTTKGALAVSMGYAANVPYDVEIGVPEVPVDGVSQEVEALIASAVANRPDLMAAQARAQAASARARAARSDLLPSLSLSGSAGRTWTDGEDDYKDRAAGSLVLNLPIFGGFSGRHDLARAQAEAEAASERARGLKQQVVYEIFVAHSDFLTSTERVRTVDELMASATQSEEVARGRYQEGVGDILDLLSAQRALAEARAAQVGARLGWYISLAQLARDAGVLGLHGENPLAPGALHPEVEK